MPRRGVIVRKSPYSRARGRTYTSGMRARTAGRRFRLSKPIVPGGYGRFRNIRTGGFIGKELKFYDTKLVASALTAPTDAAGGEHDPSATIVLNSVTQGDGEQQRDGRKMTMKSIYINGLVTVVPQANVTAGDPASVIYIALVLDTQTNGATIVSEEVYENKSADGILAASPMRNLQQSTRFRVLAKKQFTMQNPNLSWDGTNMEQQGLSRTWKMYVNLKNMNVLFKGTTESVANIVDNSLHLIAYTSSTSLAPLLYYNSRLRFQG